MRAGDGEWLRLRLGLRAVGFLWVRDRVEFGGLGEEECSLIGESLDLLSLLSRKRREQRRDLERTPFSRRDPILLRVPSRVRRSNCRWW